jgi:hypothetical protein
LSALGVDIPTVAHWLGHSDGGALAMKVYGHLRREHSASMAQKVTFQTAWPNLAVSLRRIKSAFEIALEMFPAYGIIPL